MPRRILTFLAAACLWAIAAAPAAAAPRYLGIQVHPLWGTVSHAQMLREVDHLAELGVNVARADVAWSSLQTHGPDGWESWYVDKLDAFVAAAGARGIKVIATLTETPCWASTAPPRIKQGCEGSWWDRNVQDYAPADPVAYAKVARFVTERYGAKLAALELWNEPNLSYEFIAPQAEKAARYAALVRAAYPEAKRGSRKVPVIVGATGYADVDFLSAVFAAGITGAHDGLSFHPYSDGRGPESEVASEHLEFGPGIRSVRALQTAVGQRKPLWLTEFGFTACSWCGPLAQQAQLIGDTVRAIPRFPFVRGATLYQLRDMETIPDSWEDNFGLLREDFSRRPAFAAFRSAVAEVAAQRRRAARPR